MTHYRPLSSLLIPCLLALPLTALAQDTPAPKAFNWVLSVGLTFGGDDLATAEVDDSDYEEEVEAGGLLGLGAGINYRFGNTPFSMQGVVGYHYDYVDADNGDASFERTFFDVVAQYQFRRHRLSAGITQHFNVAYKIDSDQEDRTDDFDDATGLIIEYTYIAFPSVGVGIRYTDIEYDWSDYDLDPVDGSNVGLFIHGFF